MLAQIQGYAFQIGSLKQVKHRGSMAAKELLPSLCTAAPRTFIDRKISATCYSSKGGIANKYPKHLSSLSFPGVLARWWCLKGIKHGSCFTSLFWTSFWSQWAMSVTPNGWVAACLSALTCWKLPPCSSGWRRWKTPCWEQEFPGWGIVWPAVLNCTAGKVHRAWQPRRRENPRGKKAKQARNKCKWKGCAKAPLHGLVAAGSCLHPRAPGAHKVLSTTDSSSPAAPACVIQVPACNGDNVLVLDKGQLWAGDCPCAPEQGLHHNSAHEQAPPHCNGTFPCGLTVLPGLLVGSQQSCGLYGKMLTQQVGRDGGKAWEVQGIQYGHTITD